MNKKFVGMLLLGAALATAPTAAMAETVTIDFGNPVISVDAHDFIMEGIAGAREDGVILVPVRDVAEAFQGTVVYDESQSQVRLTLPNGNWAIIDIGNVVAIEDDQTAYESSNADGVPMQGTFINDRLYVPAELMATCLGAHFELIDYGRDEVFRMIYHVR